MDPKWNQSESPYTSMGNNPVKFNDVLGNTVEDWFKNLRTGEVREDKDVSGNKGDEVSLYGGTDTWKNLGKTENDPDVEIAKFYFNLNNHSSTYPWATGRIDQDHTFDGGYVGGVVVGNIAKPILGVAYKYIASKFVSKTQTLADDFNRVRHHTSKEALDGIKKTGMIYASRGVHLGVDVEVYPFLKPSAANFDNLLVGRMWNFHFLLPNYNVI